MYIYMYINIHCLLTFSYSFIPSLPFYDSLMHGIGIESVTLSKNTRTYLYIYSHVHTYTYICTIYITYLSARNWWQRVLLVMWKYTYIIIYISSCMCKLKYTWTYIPISYVSHICILISQHGSGGTDSFSFGRIKMAGEDVVGGGR